MPIKEAADYVGSRISGTPAIAFVLGSGLGAVADDVVDATIIPYADIPGFHVSTVSGHRSRIVSGTLDGVRVLMMQGRFHLYEGHPLDAVVMPVRMLRAMGVQLLVVTNAAGAVNPSFHPGDLMIIEDHINLTGLNPLVGPNDDATGPRFPDMGMAYSPRLTNALVESARHQAIPVQKGIYAGMLGPTYETPAEVRMLRTLGADACGMSTVHEVIAAVHSGIEVAGLSCITNMGAGITPQALHHEDVMGTAHAIIESFRRLIRGFANTVVSGIEAR